MAYTIICDILYGVLILKSLCVKSLDRGYRIEIPIENIKFL